MYNTKYNNEVTPCASTIKANTWLMLVIIVVYSEG